MFMQLIMPAFFATIAAFALLEATGRVAYGLTLYFSLWSVIVAIRYRPLAHSDRNEKPESEPVRPQRARRRP